MADQEEFLGPECNIILYHPTFIPTLDYNLLALSEAVASAQRLVFPPHGAHQAGQWGAGGDPGGSHNLGVAVLQRMRLVESSPEGSTSAGFLCLSSTL